MNDLEDKLRKAESQRDDFRRQLTAERQGRMLAERIADEVRARNRELENPNTWTCQRCGAAGAAMELLDGEACPNCRLVL